MVTGEVLADNTWEPAHAYPLLPTMDGPLEDVWQNHFGDEVTLVKRSKPMRPSLKSITTDQMRDEN